MEQVRALVLAAVMLTGCASEDTASPPSTTFDVSEAIRSSGPYRCAEQMSAVVATMMDTTNLQLAQDMWGYPSPATEFALNLYGTLAQLRYAEGIPAAAEALTEYATTACFDGDIANDVNRLEPGESGYVTACLDGVVPLPGEPVCTLEFPDLSNEPVGEVTATDPVPQPTQPTVEQTASSEAGSSELNLVDGAVAPWDDVTSLASVGVDDVATAIRADAVLSSCPLIWPTDPLVLFDGAGEGMEGFLTFGLTIDVPTPGGADYGGASLWIDGLAPIDTAFETWAETERFTMANGDVLELAWGQYNEARVTMPETGCVWSFGAGSGLGLEVLIASLRTLV